MEYYLYVDSFCYFNQMIGLRWKNYVKGFLVREPWLQCQEQHKIKTRNGNASSALIMKIKWIYIILLFDYKTKQISFENAFKGIKNVF